METPETQRLRSAVRIISIGVFALPAAFADGAQISFNQDIRPVLAGNCYDCHGPDEESRKAGLRLDQRESAEEVFKNGEFVGK